MSVSYGASYQLAVEGLDYMVEFRFFCPYNLWRHVGLTIGSCLMDACYSGCNGCAFSLLARLIGGCSMNGSSKCYWMRCGWIVKGSSEWTAVIKMPNQPKPVILWILWGLLFWVGMFETLAVRLRRHRFGTGTCNWNALLFSYVEQWCTVWNNGTHCVEQCLHKTRGTRPLQILALWSI